MPKRKSDEQFKKAMEAILGGGEDARGGIIYLVAFSEKNRERAVSVVQDEMHKRDTDTQYLERVLLALQGHSEFEVFEHRPQTSIHGQPFPGS